MLGNFNQIVEQKIQEAMRNGEFDNLPSQGKPINLDQWASLPVEIRLGYTLLKNTGYLPEEVQLLKDINELRERSSGCASEAEKANFSKKITDLQLKYNLLIEQRRAK